PCRTARRRPAAAPLRRRRRLARDSSRGRASRPGARARPDRRPRPGAPARRRSSLAPQRRQVDAEGAAATLVAVELDPSLVLAHDLGGDEQAEPRAVSGLLRREERLEDVLAV